MSIQGLHFFIHNMYHRVLVAGTFDSLHAGHDALLTAACEAGEEVTVGLTSDVFVAKFKKEHIVAPFADRKQNLEEWLARHGYGDKTLIVSIDDPYEPAASLFDIEILVVTPDNKSRGEEINRIRKEKGLMPLGLLVVPLVAAQDKSPISSKRVKNGVIDKSGKLILPDSMRPELAKPVGHVLVGDAIGSSIEVQRNNIIVTVGDITTKTLLTAGVIPCLSIIDFLVERKPFDELDLRFASLNIFRVRVVSGPGYISKEAIGAIQKWSLQSKEKIMLAVSGEEDLLALPAIAYAPAGAVVYYGQPGKGLVEVIINSEKKNQAIALLEKFT